MAPPVTGFYRSNQMEVGAALQLDPDGRFKYQLDYGAVSEAAEGNWSSDGIDGLSDRDPDGGRVQDAQLQPPNR